VSRAIAVIYVPWEVPDPGDDSRYANECMDYTRRQAHKWAGTYRRWDAVEAAIKAFGATVVVVADRSHVDPNCNLPVEVAEQDAPARAVRLTVYGPARVAYPSREYGKPRLGHAERNALRAVYETARLMPRGDDGGFAEEFLKQARRSRHMSDT
jgi:hypothetical protein